MLHVDGGDHADAGVEDLLDRLPPLLVPSARHVGVRELVDEHPFRVPLDHRVGVELFEHRAAIRDLLGLDPRQSFGERDRLGPTVRLDEADDDVFAA